MERNLEPQELVQIRVNRYYRRDKVNCATTTLKILAERFELDLHDQVIHASLGMAGAGGRRAQCGLVEGGLMFLGVFGKSRGLSSDRIAQLCYDYGSEFEARFGSLSCRVLRPEGFHPDQPPHLCEPLTRDAILFDIEFIQTWLEEHGD
jgi:hypothetical protein